MFEKIKNWFLNADISFFIVFALTLGLAPFAPPHVYEKLVMLFRGELVKGIDIFDLVYHLLPWVLLGLKARIVIASRRK